MRQTKIFLVSVIFVVGWVLSSCGIAEELPEVQIPEGAAETAEAAVQSAGEAAKSAMDQAGEFAETAAVAASEKGSQAVATLNVVVTPDIENLKDKIAGIQPDRDGKFSFTISAQDLNRILLLRQLLTGPNPLSIIRNAAVEFENGLIVFGADVSKPSDTRVGIAFMASVDNGGLVFDIVEASAGEAEVSQDVLDSAEELLNNSLGEAVEHLPPNLKLRSVTIENGRMTLEGGQEEIGE